MLLSYSTSQELQKKISFYNISILGKPNDLSLWFIQGDDLICLKHIYLILYCHDQEIHKKPGMQTPFYNRKVIRNKVSGNHHRFNESQPYPLPISSFDWGRFEHDMYNN